MKGFCSGSSIEIDLELNKTEVSSLRDWILIGDIRRGHSLQETVGIELRAYAKLKVYVFNSLLEFLSISF